MNVKLNHNFSPEKDNNEPKLNIKYFDYGYSHDVLNINKNNRKNPKEKVLNIIKDKGGQYHYENYLYMLYYNLLTYENNDQTFSFGDDVDMSLIDYAELTIRQQLKNKLIKRLAKDIDNNAFYVYLSEKETLSLESGDCQLQVKIKLTDGGIVASSIETLTVNEILNGGVML